MARRIIEEDTDETYHHDVPYTHRVYERDSASGDLMGLVVLLIVLVLFFVYGLPFLRGAFSNAGGGTQINVPKSVDVNLNQQPAPAK